MSDNAQAPLGAEMVVSGAETTPNTTPNTPSVDGPVEINPDGLYKIPGSDKPVKFNDYVRGFQSQATKASQRAAELERKLQEREAAVRRYEQERANQPRQPQGQPGGDPLAELRSKPYLTGEETAQVVQSIAQEINVRDQVILAALKQLQQMQQVIRPLYETHATSSFDQKIANWIKEGDYPESYTELAKDLYMGYEPGPELDQEFPRILAERVQQVEAELDRRRKVAAENARRQPFVPGKGGVAAPSKPFKLDPRNSARADADAIWESLQGGSGT